MTVIVMVWLMMMGCPKDLLIPVVVVLGLIEGFAAGLEDGSSIFLIIFLVIGAIIYFLAKDDSKQPNKSVQNVSKNNLTSSKLTEQKVAQKINTDNKIRLYSLLEQIKHANPLDETRAIDLYEIGLLYEKLYGDYFRSTAFVYLAMSLAKNNKDYEKEYLRLSDQLCNKKGSLWEYYITLIKNVSDIEKYAEELLKQENAKTEPIKKATAKTYVQPPKPQRIVFEQEESKFEDFNPESYLHSLGYKVGKTGLSQYQRRALLKKAIESGMISKYDVIETLERNISMFQHRSNRQQAVNDWWTDLDYVKRNF